MTETCIGQHALYELVAYQQAPSIEPAVTIALVVVKRFLRRLATCTALGLPATRQTLQPLK